MEVEPKTHALMTNEELDAIVGIAKSWHLGELSLVQLLAQSRYHALRPQLSLALLQRYLKEHPEHLKHWEFYSEDKRTDGGSYLFRFGPLWEVGEIRRRPDEYYSRRFRRRFFLSHSRACASFILRELDAIATRL